MKLKNITITGLNETKNITIEIENNRLILVGENGQGKSTIVNIIYATLDCRWKELSKYNFQSVEIKVDDFLISFTKAELIGYLEFDDDDRMMRHPRGRQIHFIKRGIQEFGLEYFQNDENIKSFSDRIGVPEKMIRDGISEISHMNISGVKKIPLIQKEIRQKIKDRILFLPTYRRIEQDISYIFPRLIERMENLPDYIRSELNEATKNNIEMIKFGMEDVSDLIGKTMDHLKEQMRTRMNGLSVAFLRDTINENYKMDRSSPFFNIDDGKIGEILRRTSSDILSQNDKNRLQANLINAKKETGPLSEGQDISLFFMSKLYDVIEAQKNLEKEVVKFVEICNKYLVGKIMRFDDVKFEITINPLIIDGTPSEKNINFKVLSSGEKQIISLFCHIYLGKAKDYFIIIDEPELSLSVEWQKHFLPDIVAGKCSGIIAVTHSPFIFDNEFDVNAKSISNVSSAYCGTEG